MIAKKLLFAGVHFGKVQSAKLSSSQIRNVLSARKEAANDESISNSVMNDLKKVTSTYDYPKQFHISCGDWVAEAVDYNAVIERRLNFLSFFKALEPVNDKFVKDEELAKRLMCIINMVRLSLVSDDFNEPFLPVRRNICDC